MKQLFQTKLYQLQESLQRSLLVDLTTPSDKIINQVKELNQIIADMNYINDKLLSLIYDEKGSSNKDKFEKMFSLTDINLVY